MEITPYTPAEGRTLEGLLTDYYREGEDADTPGEVLTDFIAQLRGLQETGTISGALLREEAPLGFVLWMEDTEGAPFSQFPGEGTLLEIGLVPAARGRGLGRLLAAHAEAALAARGITLCYLSAYGPAEGFWQAAGYAPTGGTGENGLRLYRKKIGG